MELNTIYTLTAEVCVTNPVCSEKLAPGTRVMYLGEFNSFPMISSLDGNKPTNMVAPVTPCMLTILSDEVIDKAVELMVIHSDDVKEEYLRKEVHTKHGYKFVKMAQHILENYTPNK